MPLEQGNTNVVRLYKREDAVLEYVYFGQTPPPGTIATPTSSNPDGQSCSIDGHWLVYTPESVTRYYRCQAVSSSQTEITHLKDNSNQTIHKRVTISFNYNGATGSSSQIRTWDVEQITQPPNPVRSGYDFQGWATTSGASSPNVTFPRDTPENDITYYAVWKQKASQLKWQYQGSSSSPFCICSGANPIGTSCSTAGSTQIVCGADIGKSDQCSTLVCKA